LLPHETGGNSSVSYTHNYTHRRRTCINS
jgi:hypothetical protein